MRSTTIWVVLYGEADQIRLARIIYCIGAMSILHFNYITDLCGAYEVTTNRSVIAKSTLGSTAVPLGRINSRPPILGALTRLDVRLAAGSPAKY